MNWLFRWISADADLAPWERAPFSADVEKGPGPCDNQDNHERLVGCEPAGLPTPDGIARRVADAILRFDVFPRTLLTPVLRRTPVEIGDAIGLRYHFVPGIDLFFAARVIDRFEEVTDGSWRCGFKYRTVAGHPECGEETFVVEKDLATGNVTAALRSWSRPGTWLATLTYPVVRRLQLWAGRAALDHLQKIANDRREGEAPADLGLSQIHGSAGVSPSRRKLRTNLIWSGGQW